MEANPEDNKILFISYQELLLILMCFEMEV